MTNTELKRRIFSLVFVLLLIFLVVSLIFLYRYLSPIFNLFFKIIAPFLLSGFIVYLLHPVVEKLESHRIPRPLSVLFIFVILLLAIGTVIFKTTPYIINEGKQLLEQLPDLANTYRQLSATLSDQSSYLPETFQRRMDQWIQRGESWIAASVEQFGVLLLNLLDWALFLIVIPFIAFYGLKDYPLLKKTVWYLTPKQMRAEGRQLVKEVDQTLGSYIRGQLIVCLIVGLLAWLGFWIINMPYGTLLAIVIGITNVIPYFGPILGTVPVVLLALTESPLLVVGGLAIILIIQLIEGNILAPVIIGKSIHTHPLLIILALVVGNEIGGIIGLIVAVPLLAVAKVLLLHFRRLIRERRGIYD
ncbi:AI-2E family transporter [Salipaludibacillus sp. LMS25]|jgi:predicted PurR-regulated permease PerM|uniref:AI-2E family transporter n=1 Tax=Salipaludibacillus sp. LMS25 TaxID=2924031 RepID=UPI0020D0B7B2|nr:AI-2E family transporter [Salipaludibacillus sp. LMS25]UTR14282.1 AI-2E family transporter [Salipaludibacillus sp. LMS25]